MYEKFDITKSLVEDASKFMMENDRMLYEPFFRTAESFCSKHKVVIGGMAGLYYLLNKSVDKDFFQWDLYADDAYETAKLLALELHGTYNPHIDVDTVVLDTRIKGQELSISIMTRRLFRIFNLDRYRGVKLVEIMEPVVCKGMMSGEDIFCFPPYMQLIGIYRDLYNPGKIGNAIANLMLEDALSNELPTRTGGGTPDRKIANIAVARTLGRKYTMVGDFAISALLGIDNIHCRAQFIACDVDEFAAECSNIVKSKFKNLGPIKIAVVSYHLNIPSDFRIKKFTVYAQDGRNQTPLADVFNSSCYEMIPWSMAGVDTRVANPLVILRFMLIDIYLMRLVAKMTDSQPHDRAKTLQSQIKPMRDYMRAKLAEDPLQIFQLSDYDGSIRNEDAAKNKLVKDLGIRVAPFFPAKRE